MSEVKVFTPTEIAEIRAEHTGCDDADLIQALCDTIEALRGECERLKAGCRVAGPAGLGCFDCGREYGDEHGFPDMLVPNEQWKAISPDGEGNGVLCPSCICKRLHDAGLEKVPVYFASGPCCMPSTAEADHALESMVRTREEADRYWEQIAALTRDIEEARGIVGECEWAACDDGGALICPICGEREFGGSGIHKPDCPLAAWLAKHEKKQGGEMKDTE